MTVADEDLSVKWSKIATHRLEQPAPVVLVGDRVHVLSSSHTYLSRSSCKWTILNNENPRRQYQGHTATLVNDKIYLIGGLGQGGIWDSSDMIEFDLITGEFSSVSDEDYPGGPGEICDHSAVFAESRKAILVSGGSKRGTHEDATISSDVYAFSVEHRKWSRLVCTGRRPKGILGHHAVMFGKRMYVYGGRDRWFDSQREVWIGNLERVNEVCWSTPRVQGIPPIPPIQSAPNSGMYLAMNVFNARLVVVGDKTPTDVNQRLCMYNSSLREWTWISASAGSESPLWERTHISGVALHDGILYLTQSGVFIARFN